MPSKQFMAKLLVMLAELLWSKGQLDSIEIQIAAHSVGTTSFTTTLDLPRVLLFPNCFLFLITRFSLQGSQEPSDCIESITVTSMNGSLTGRHLAVRHGHSKTDVGTGT